MSIAAKWQKKVYVAFEIGGTMDGYESAFRLLNIAANSGADAIKIQLLQPSRLVQGQATVQFSTVDGRALVEKQIDALRRRTLTRQEWMEFSRTARYHDIDIIATVDFPESLTLAFDMGAAAIKICSGDITYTDWIGRVASKCCAQGVPILLDTGHASLEELNLALKACEDAGVTTMVHHVAGGYPAKISDVNLSILRLLSVVRPEVYLGYSSHHRSWSVDAAAVALGACMVEKNLTLDATRPGPEQSTAVEPFQAREYVDFIRHAGLAIGSSRNFVGGAKGASEASRNARRSAYAYCTIMAGDVIREEHINWGRPEDPNGFRPGEPGLIGGVAMRDITTTELIYRTDVR
jgi:sialic acid synthase SpsE